MSGEAVEIAMEANSVNSALIWTDNPEVEYFRTMMADRVDDKLASGLDLDDSLIGDSTVQEILGVGSDDESDIRNDGVRIQHKGVRETSGLSDAESNTVDNIYIGDESILAMKKTLNRVFDDTTIESFPIDNDLAPPFAKTQIKQKSESKTPKFGIPRQHPSQEIKSGEGCAPNKKLNHLSSPQMNVPPGRHHNHKTVEIPGFIFVTDGQPSIVNTQPDKPSIVNTQLDNTTKHVEIHKYRRGMCLPRTLIICLALVVVVASTVVAVLVYLIKSESSMLTSSTNGQNKDLVSPPTVAPSGLRASYPTWPGLPKVLTSSPTELLSTSRPTPGTAIPTSEPSMSPTYSPTNATAIPSSAPSALSFPENTNSPTMVASFATTEACESVIRTDKSCYRSGESIQLSFINCEPTSSDWIGVYPARQSMLNLRQPSYWIMACGDQSCNNPVSSGEETMAASGFGSFRMMLLRDDGFNGFSAYAIGRSFTISPRCD